MTLALPVKRDKGNGRGLWGCDLNVSLSLPRALLGAEFPVAFSRFL